MAMVYTDGDSRLNEALAKQVAETLTWAYPNHSWWVEARGGILIVKHFMLSGMRGVVCMVKFLDKLDWSATHLRAEVIRAAGEMLERAHLTRGAFDGTIPTAMELDTEQAQRRWGAALPVEVIH